MGAKNIKSSNSDINKKNLKNKLNVETDIICPGCNKIYPKNSSFDLVRKHLNTCLDMGSQNNINQSPINDYIIGTQKTNKIKQKTATQYFYQKIPQNQQKTKFKWIKKAILQIDPSKISHLTKDQIKKLSFQQKHFWFRHFLQQKRISWTYGADFMEIQKQNVLISSFVAYKKINMHKQVKIFFKGDKVNDAGGLLREWIHMIIKEVFNSQTGIFTIANTDQIMYKFKWDQQLDEQYSRQLLTLFGVIIGKAILEKIPILSYLDRSILRQITNQPIQYSDIQGFDKGLYQSWKFLLQNQINDMGLQTFFTIHKQSELSTVKQIQLIQNGSEIQVTDLNKQLYINSCIQHLCIQAVKRSVTSLKNGIYQVIPSQLFSIFEPYELQMILYGVPQINVDDWKQNTQYKGEYHTNHKTIKWFWEVIEEFNQQKLANVLHFTTGSSRTPIQGFRFLESNRGNIARFLIQQAVFNQQNPYPKGHTCFNRLQLPKYPSKQILKTYLEAIANNHLDGIFGLD